MDTRLLLAWLHLLALAVGLSGVWARARALRDSLRYPTDAGTLRRAFVGDAWWGVAAVIWLATGLWRLLAGTEKATGYYMGSRAFAAKMALFAAILALESWPMLTLVRWRLGTATPNPRDARRIEAISYLQGALVVAMVLAATATARGYGMRSASAPVAAAPVAAPRDSASAAVPIARPAPSGTETVTNDDLALLTREIAMPLDGVDPKALVSGFDARRGGGTRRHRALDLMAPRRTPIRSAATGRVLKLFRSVAGGLMVYAADSSERFVLLYAHLDGYAPGLKEGDRIARGQLLGYVGSTGNASASAPHLHFAIARSADVTRWSRGAPIDPLPVLRAAAAPATRAAR